MMRHVFAAAGKVSAARDRVGGSRVFYHKLFTLVLPTAFQHFMLSAVSASDAVLP